ncbi:MAG: MFS transporter, partial [Phycisphaeraceae bacterium]
WLVCIIAAIGFAFDIYELLMLPLIARHAMLDLGGIKPGTPEFSKWFALLFYVPAIAGGIFGLLGGYLTDLFGRRRVLTFSILLYAFSAFFAGFSTSMEMLLFFRCLVFIGVCIEFVAAVAWLAELFPDPKQREKVLGYTQAFSSFGGFLVAVANGMAVTWGPDLPAISAQWIPFVGGEIKDHHAAWRYTLMSGLIPALPLLIIRPFLPESPAWKAKKDSGKLKRPSVGQLFSTPELRRTTIITTLMFAMSFGAAFGAIQVMPQILPGLAEVKQEVADATAKIMADNAALPAAQQKTEAQLKGVIAASSKQIEQAQTSTATKIQEAGGLVGRFILAMLAVIIISRRKLIRIFIIPGIIIMPLAFGVLMQMNLSMLWVGIFVAALLTVGQFSFWGNYLPRVFPLHLRGTGESFAANIGGRMIGTSFAAVTAMIAGSDWVPGESPAAKFAYTAAAIGVLVYIVNFALSFALPEPGAEDLPE